MFRELLKSFIIGSSILSFIIFFIGVTYFIKYEKSVIFDYHTYSILAPIGLGFASLFAKYIHLMYNIKLKKAYFIISILSALFICLKVTIEWEQVYNFKIYTQRAHIQYLLIFMAHLFVYNIIIYSLDVYL
jgi:hypothetical protein